MVLTSIAETDASADDVAATRPAGHTAEATAAGRRRQAKRDGGAASGRRADRGAVALLVCGAALLGGSGYAYLRLMPASVARAGGGLTPAAEVSSGDVAPSDRVHATGGRWASPAPYGQETLHASEPLDPRAAAALDPAALAYAAESAEADVAGANKPRSSADAAGGGSYLDELPAPRWAGVAAAGPAADETAEPGGADQGAAGGGVTLLSPAGREQVRVATAEPTATPASSVRGGGVRRPVAAADAGAGDSGGNGHSGRRVRGFARRASAGSTAGGGADGSQNLIDPADGGEGVSSPSPVPTTPLPAPVPTPDPSAGPDPVPSPAPTPTPELTPEVGPGPEVVPPTDAEGPELEEPESPGDAAYRRDVERFVSFYNIGWSTNSPRHRNIGWNVATRGWANFIRFQIQPQIDFGVRRFQLHNPFGDIAGEAMQLDQYQHAQEAGLLPVVNGFVEAWRPITDQGIEVIGYVGCGMHDPDFDSLEMDAWLERAFASVQPMLDAGMSIGLDAAIFADAGSPPHVFAQQLRERGVRVYIESKPMKTTPHWFDFDVILLDPNWLHSDIETGHPAAKNYGIPDGTLTGEVVRMIRPRKNETQQDLDELSEVKARIRDILDDGHSVSVLALTWLREAGSLRELLRADLGEASFD